MIVLDDGTVGLRLRHKARPIVGTLPGTYPPRPDKPEALE
jgi:hypothetical protein